MSVKNRTELKPELSRHYASRQPSAIRLAQIEFMKRTDKVKDINVAIGNVSLPMHPAMIERMNNLGKDGSPFEDGVVKYSSTVGFEETNKAFLNIIGSSGFETSNLYTQVTDGGSAAMELVIMGVCGDAGTDDKPLLLIDAAYTNYKAFADRLGKKTVSVKRTLMDNGKFALPDIAQIQKVIDQHKPGAVVIIPYDNPTGHFYDKESLIKLCRLCTENNMWLISDEAYRELFYVNHDTVSIWGLTENDVPGITGRRISIETASKVWNACGLRIGGIITDNEEFNRRCIAENTANLCPNVIGQYIFGSLAKISHKDLNEWYQKLRTYYFAMLKKFNDKMHELLPGVIVSSPDASIYSVIDVRNLVDESFNAADFVLYCSQKGKVSIDDNDNTLLVAPMSGFYNLPAGDENPGRTQMRVAYVEKPETMDIVPKLFVELFKQYQKQ